MGACEINQKDLEKALAVTHPTMTVNKLLITMAAPMVLSLLIGALLSRFLGERKQREVNQTNDVEIISMGVDYLTVICVFGFGQMIAMLLGLSTAVFGAYFKLQTFVYMAILGGCGAVFLYNLSVFLVSTQRLLYWILNKYCMFSN